MGHPQLGRCSDGCLITFIAPAAQRAGNSAARRGTAETGAISVKSRGSQDHVAVTYDDSASH